MARDKLTPRQANAIRMIVYEIRPFATETEIAAACGVSRRMLYEWRRDPLFAEELRKEHEKRWADSANDAMKQMIELAKAGDRLAAQYILDSAGYSAPQKVELSSTDIRITVGDDD